MKTGSRLQTGGRPAQPGLHLKRGEGTSRDLAGSISWFEKAASQGHILSAYELAVAYDLGLGVPTNPDLAMKHYKSAGERNHVPSIRRLTAIYARGELGLPVDQALARYWGRKLNAAVRENTWMSPVQPSRSSRCGQSVGTSKKLPF